ncbi:type II toxin-antitoxin system RelE/ParE family toxin [Asticcacaulis sp. AC402]|uniref:type II toxin-antitoxin system RelE/ParE family toxin n=1 Tax=Asticcacaulis sp. AC402 TaxID=1282361 RepID=UPI0003C3B7A7|nr:hypothetical protein ABAC402_12350 [Asticcacaulis sp. AC402]
MRLGFSPSSDRDLEDIADFIATDSPARAFTYIDEIRARCFRLLDAPNGGSPRDDLRQGLRVVPFGNYLIFYRIYPGELRIERILHGARNLAAIFDNDN